MYTTDDELFALMKNRLYTPVMGDILDQLGCYHQFLPAVIQPMELDMKIAGRAMPVLFTEVYGEQPKLDHLRVVGVRESKHQLYCPAQCWKYGSTVDKERCSFIFSLP